MKIPENPRIVLAGSVNSSRKTLEKLVEHDLQVVGVLGLSLERSKNVSGYNDLSEVARAHELPFQHFDKINAPEVVEFVREARPDLLFVVGLSQMVREELLAVPTVGCVGFHPTRLPEGRGRGAVAWMILGAAPGAATFFLMDEGMDSGPILVQEPFEVTATDYAADVIEKIKTAIGKGLDQALPRLKAGTLPVAEQDHSKATYLGKRAPKDGLIDWNRPAEEIHRLIRAASAPLPGAYTYFQGNKMVIQRARLVKDLPLTGVPGRVVQVETSGEIIVQTGAGLLALQEISGGTPEKLRVGRDLGLNYELEIQQLKEEIAQLKQA